jgi:hypothetical protein
MTAMQAASDNADDLVKALSLQVGFQQLMVPGAFRSSFEINVQFWFLSRFSAVDDRMLQVVSVNTVFCTHSVHLCSCLSMCLIFCFEDGDVTIFQCLFHESSCTCAHPT